MLACVACTFVAVVAFMLLLWCVMGLVVICGGLCRFKIVITFWGTNKSVTDTAHSLQQIHLYMCVRGCDSHPTFKRAKASGCPPPPNHPVAHVRIYSIILGIARCVSHVHATFKCPYIYFHARNTKKNKSSTSLTIYENTRRRWIGSERAETRY